MFEEFFGLTTKPFGKTPDPGFLYESAQHGEALARLEYAVEEKELSLLVGEIGSGKTTLSRALIDRCGSGWGCVTASARCHSTKRRVTSITASALPADPAIRSPTMPSAPCTTSAAASRACSIR